MTYQETLDYIHAVQWTGCRPGLSRITALLDALGNPQDALQFVHVAGTNGKGSVSAMTESILRKAGYHTGLYTSPYIWKFNERMAVDACPISDEELMDITSYVRPFADTMEDKPTEFELITAVAMVYFKRHQCDIVVLEVGLGGRLDATNVIKHPVASVITGIALDHMAVLGSTIPQIAYEKAGIIKEGVPVIFGGENEQAAKVIADVACEKHAPLIRVNRSSIMVKDASLTGCTMDYQNFIDVKLALPGLYQPFNCATVLELCRILQKIGLHITEKHIYAGLATAVWRGRFEVLCKNPLIISDGSHNPEGVSCAVKSIKYYFPTQKIHLVTGVMKDKNYPQMAKWLSPLCRKVYTVLPDNPKRALSPETLAQVYLDLGTPAEGYETVKQALIQAIANGTQNNEPIICLGSLYMYGQVKQALIDLHYLSESS